jgi:hypothetical protein
MAVASDVHRGESSGDPAVAPLPASTVRVNAHEGQINASATASAARAARSSWDGNGANNGSLVGHWLGELPVAGTLARAQARPRDSHPTTSRTNVHFPVDSSKPNWQLGQLEGPEAPHCRPVVHTTPHIPCKYLPKVKGSLAHLQDSRPARGTKVDNGAAAFFFRLT